MSDNDSESLEELATKNVLRTQVQVDAMQEGINHLPTQERADVASRWLQESLTNPYKSSPLKRLSHLIDQSGKKPPPPPPPEPPAPNPALANAHGFDSDDLIKIDPDGLLAFANKLEDKAAEIEQELPAKRAKVEEAFRREARMYTKDSQVPPVFQPLGKALAVALDKLEQNVQGVTGTLRNDARLLRELVDKHDENERRAAQGFDSVNARPRG